MKVSEKSSSGRSPEAFAGEKANEKMTPVMEGFSPAGMKVLVVDDDPVCLMILEAMLRQCNYTVTTCQRAAKALALLRENGSAYDLVMSDVYMPDMDGFKLLEAIGLELDLPVIMMSANGETDVVLKGITHGACDYLLKPVRIEELRNIWQHVIRRRGGRGEAIRDDQSAVDWDESGRGLESPSREVADISSSKKRKEMQEMQEEPLDEAQLVEDVNSLKKARVVWSVELHQQFVNAVNQLGFEKAVPKRILEIMNVQGLSREHVASHLQKYRQYLKRLSGVNTQPYPVATFQAAPAGNFAGSMQVQPGGRGVAASAVSNAWVSNVPRTDSTSSSFVGMAREPVSHIDSTTLSLLAQLQAHQQGQEAGRLPSSMLGGVNTQLNMGVSPGFTNRPPNPSFAGLEIMNSIELDMLMEAAQQDSLSRQQGVGTSIGDEMFGLGRGHSEQGSVSRKQGGGTLSGNHMFGLGRSHIGQDSLSRQQGRGTMSGGQMFGLGRGHIEQDSLSRQQGGGSMSGNHMFGLGRGHLEQNSLSRQPGGGTLSGNEMFGLGKAHIEEDSLSRQQGGGTLSGNEMFGLGRGHIDLTPGPLQIGVDSFKREDESNLIPGFGPPSPSPYPASSKRGLSDSSYSSGFGD